MSSKPADLKLQAMNAPALVKGRRKYSTPVLHVYGELRDITRGTGSKKPGDAKAMKVVSDPRSKTDICRVGTHPLGVGIYLYRYRPVFQAEYGEGVQLGIMADELARVMPSAVSVLANGYHQVDYAQLKPPIDIGMLCIREGRMVAD
ncbi:MAG: hypothetical protein RLZZ271_860 [Pseudomonadota bacterium]|jgi:hypothetical protein